MKIKFKRSVLPFALSIAFSGAVFANNDADLEFPKVSTWTSFATGTGYYVQASVIGSIVKEKLGSNIRIIPARNDIARYTPIREGRADYTMSNIASYYSQEGLYTFSNSDWGPQPARIVLSNFSNQGLALAVAADEGIESVSDLRGKRVVWFKGVDSVNLAIAAFLAYGGLTWDDVQKVEVDSPNDAVNAMLNGIADAYPSSTGNPINERVMNSPRGFKFLHMPAKTEDDKARWNQAISVVPYMRPVTATKGIGVSSDNPVYGGNYPTPILSNNDGDGLKEKEVYSLVKTWDENFNTFVTKAPEADGWDISKQDLAWLVPYHDGSIRYFKEKGLWTEEHQRHHERLLERQKVLKDAWDNLKSKSAGNIDPDEWASVRVKSLIESGFEPGLK